MLSYYYITVSATIIWTTFAESISNQAVSLQSYDRGDVPLSYKHNVIHTYTTSKPYQYFNNNPRDQRQEANYRLTNYHHIQYAPLSYKTPERESHNDKLGTDTKTTAFNDDISGDNNLKPEYVQKTPLEPQFDSTSVPTYTRAQLNPPIHGYNVNTRALNKILKEYDNKNDQNLLVGKKQLKMNYFEHWLPYPKSENIQNIQTTEAVLTTLYSKPNGLHTVFMHQNLQDVNKYNPNILTRKENIEPYNFYVKASKVALNVARALNIARTQHKATINMNTSFRKLPSLPQDFFFNSLVFHLPKAQINPYTQKEPKLNP